MPDVIAGVDLGGTKIQVVLLRDQQMLASERGPTPRSGGAADVIQAVAEAVTGALETAGLEPGDLRAVGIGSPGEIDQRAGTVSRAANVPGFFDTVALADELSRQLGGVPVSVDNDVRAAVRGEHQRGAGRPYRNFLGVFVGTGVGGGLVLENELREGRGAAGEIGHTVVKDGGRECSCKRRGCLEAYAGRGRIEVRARELAKQGRHTELFDIMRKHDRDRVTSGVIAKALDKGDELTVELIDDAVWALGLALASAQNLLDLEAIIVGGGLGDRLGRPFVDRIAESMRPHVFVDTDPPAMLTTELGDLSGAVGAAVLAGG
ncbi:MAG TPA: ROK family protein [Actinomycetota bacterium]|jgi:glucokinase